MAAALDAGEAVARLGAASLLAAGAVVALRGAADRPGRAGAVFLLALGTATVAGLAGGPDTVGDPVRLGGRVAGILAGAALVVLLLDLPRPLAAAERRPAMLALGLVVANVAATWMLAGLRPPEVERAVVLVSGASLASGLLLAALLLPIRYLGEGGVSADEEQRATAWLALGLGTFAAVQYGSPFYIAVASGLAVPALTLGLDVVTLGLAAALWLRNTLEATLAEARRARAVALLLLAALVGAVLAGRLMAEGPLNARAAPGIAGVACAAMVAYALLVPWRAARRQA